MGLRNASTALIVAAGIVLVAWNGSRFVGAVPQTRTKNLDFLPSPEVARALTLGHHNSVAKLRWIDSFAYFELQLDRKDDTVAGTGESAFERLYRMLLGLDPHFVPFYESACLNLGGVLNHHNVVLGMLEGGLLDLPHERKLWRLTATELVIINRLEQSNPNAMQQFLTAWCAAETDDEGRQQVWDWQKAMGRRVYRDLQQLPYWEEQLRVATPGTPTQAFVIDTMREQVARYGEETLGRLLAARVAHTKAPLVRLDDLLDPALVAEVYPTGIPPYAPFALVDGAARMHPDPFGYAYGLVDGKPSSPGWEALRARQRATLMNVRLEALAKRTGEWPATLDAAVAAGLVLDALPDHCHWRLNDKHIEVQVDLPPFPAWAPLAK